MDDIGKRAAAAETTAAVEARVNNTLDRVQLLATEAGVAWTCFSSLFTALREAQNQLASLPQQVGVRASDPSFAGSLARISGCLKDVEIFVRMHDFPSLCSGMLEDVARIRQRVKNVLRMEAL